MAPIKHQNLQLPGKFKKPKSLNRTLQILLSISVFSFLFLYSSCLLTYVNSLHLLFSTYISDFFSYYINRQVMFILCNSILVFVTQGYGLIGHSASMAVTDDLHDEFNMKNRDYRGPTLDIVEMQVSVGDEEGMAESVGTLVPVEKEEEDGYDGGDENEMATGESAEIVGPLVPVEKEEEDGYDGGDDNEMVNGESDERFEDFIKKTKEKMRTEALQLVLVV
ncbi:hypothetical protein AAC387_Pa02g1340 [Persea americana]